MARLTAVDVKTYWNDEPLKNDVALAFREAVLGVVGVAKTGAPSSAVSRSVYSFFYNRGSRDNLEAIVRARSPLAHLFELGTEPHNIAPKNSLAALIEKGRSSRSTRQGRRVSATKKGKVAMKFPDGNFSRGSVRHPGMKEEPFMRPAAAAFPALYNRALARRL